MTHSAPWGAILQLVSDGGLLSAGKTINRCLKPEACPSLALKIGSTLLAEAN